MSESGSAVYDQLQRENKRATRLLLIGSVLIVAIMVWARSPSAARSRTATLPSPPA